MRAPNPLLILVFLISAATSGFAQSPGDWPMYARDHASTGFSQLMEITPANVSGLKQVCSYPLPENVTFESSLVTINGTMYFTTSAYTYALNAANCSLKWRVQHEMQGAGGTVRGVAVDGNRLFRGFRDGFVVAYNIEDGRQLWATRLMEPEGIPAPIAAAPITWNGMVFVGTSGAERACGCMIAGLDGATGRLLWTFQISAREGPGSETWPKGVHIGGGSVWSAFSIDTQAGLLYSPTGNPGPDFFGDYRPGLNLYTGSVIALDAKTGALKSYYQLVPHDYHDWDQAAAPALVTTRGGRKRAMAGGKDGYLHAIDIASGKVAWKTPVTSIVNAEAPLTPEGTFFCPGAAGGVEWNGPAFSPATNLVYTNAVDWCSTVKIDTKPPVFEAGKQFLGTTNGFGVYDSRKAGWVTAVDADSGVVRWRQEIAAPVVAGIAVTASGLVMTGDLNGDFVAFDAATGKVLHRIQTQQPVGGGVVTYQAGGKQYVGVAAGLADAIMQSKGQAAVIIFGL
jgi:alcohol dehydrogenase (cytochrome c)